MSLKPAERGREEGKEIKLPLLGVVFRCGY
jgi:hypothetical protein